MVQHASKIRRPPPPLRPPGPPWVQGGPKGSYCKGEYNNGTCVENPADCGQLGKACCQSLSERARQGGMQDSQLKVTLLPAALRLPALRPLLCPTAGGCCSSYKCDPGLFCPFMDTDSPTCKPWCAACLPKVACVG